MKLSPYTPKRTDGGIDYNTFASIYNRIRKILNIKFDKNYFKVIDSDAGMFITSIPIAVTTTPPEPVIGIDLSAFAFGCSFSTDQVTVLPGNIRRGFTEKYYIDGATFTLGGSYKWSYITYDLVGRTGSLVTNASSVPEDTIGTMYIPLHQYLLTNGIASIASGGVHSVGDILLPGETA